MELVFATHNRHKLEEAIAIAGAAFSIKGLTDIGCFEEIPETADSLLGNATQKAEFVYQKYHCNCFSDDTGLEIDALNGRPGVHSARYAGEKCDFQDNVRKVMNEMSGISNRKACFRTIIVLFLNHQKYIFEGRVDGEIIDTEKGFSGFGYDPIFRPLHSNLTFAEMDESEKNKISHRAKTIKKMMDFLNASNNTFTLLQ